MRADCIPRRAPLAIALVIAAASVGIEGCEANRSPLEVVIDPGSVPAVVSDTVVRSASSQQGAVGASFSPAAATTREAPVVYVSLSPGSIPTGVAATIRNQATASTVTAPMIDGGFDPVAVTAMVNETLEFEVQLADNAPVLRFARRVPAVASLSVVRTGPSRGKRQVRVNSRIQVVFSEPINPNTVTTGSLQLLLAGSPVTGHVGVEGPDNLTATFTPDGLLAGNTTYQIVVGTAIRDLDGQALESAFSSDFTTSATEAVGPLSRIAMTSNEQIYVMDADGSDLRLLPVDGRKRYRPSWSPDGAWLAFYSSSPFDGLLTIDVINSDGSQLRRLANGRDPAWSPQGTRIAFNGEHGGIHLMNPDGSARAELTSLAGDRGPTWSPDGSRIAFEREDQTGEFDIYVMNADGSAVTRLTTSNSTDTDPAWSPDGSKIAFTRDSEIYVMNSDGSGVARLTNVPDWDAGPTWSPDGTRIAFASSRGRTSPYYSEDQIYVMNADGSGVVRLTDVPSPGYARAPAWSRNGAVPPAPSVAIEKIAGDNQTDTVNATLGTPLRVRVLRDGIPAPGTSVRWTTNDRAGALSATSTVTDADGTTAVTWKLGVDAGSRAASAFVDAGTQAAVASFVATGNPGQLAALGSFLNGTLLAEINSPIEVGVIAFDSHDGDVSRGNPLTGVPITFSVTEGGGTITPAFGLTRPRCAGWESPPCALSVHTIGPSEGTHVATATAYPAVGAPLQVTFSTTAVTKLVYILDEYLVPPRFATPDVTVSSGQTVGWWSTNHETSAMRHNVTFEDDPSEPVSSDTRIDLTHTRMFFGPPRTIRYRCTVHSTSFTEGMVGTVTVR